MKKTDRYFLIACIVLLAAIFTIRALDRIEGVPLKMPLEALAFHVQEFRGERLAGSLDEADETTADSWVLRQYRAGDGSLPIRVLVAYWEKQDETKKMRPPSYAYRGYYWVASRSIQVDGQGTVVFRQFLDVREDVRELIYYCYILDGRPVPSEYRLRYMSMTNSLLHGRTNAALIKISLVLRDGWSLEDGQGYAERFIKAFLPAAKASLAM